MGETMDKSWGFNYTYTSVPKLLITDRNLSNNTKIFALKIICFGFEDELSTPSTLAMMLDIKLSSIQKYINELITCGWLIKEFNKNTGEVIYTQCFPKTEDEK
jgi:hypothetical protein